MTPTTEELLGDTARTRLLVIDSGVGGLAYVRRLLRIRDSYDVYYVADTAGFPYGEKPTEELRDHLLRLLREALLRFPADLTLIACNTASVTALDAFRERYSLPFVGTVPAVKPAAALTESGTLALLATSATVGDDYTDRLVREFADGYRVLRSGAPELVRRIEGGFPQLSRTAAVEQLVRTELSDFAENGADVVVLGCTHFLHITGLLQRVIDDLGISMRLVDSLDGVARRVVDLTRRERLPRGSRSGSDAAGATGTLVTTRLRSAGGEHPEARRYRRIAEAFRLEYGGVLEL